jgi:hypothetical protein
MRQMMLAEFSVSILIKGDICSDRSVIEPKSNEVISKCNPKPAIQNRLDCKPEFRPIRRTYRPRTGGSADGLHITHSRGMALSNSRDVSIIPGQAADSCDSHDSLMIPLTRPVVRDAALPGSSGYFCAERTKKHPPFHTMICQPSIQSSPEFVASHDRRDGSKLIERPRFRYLVPVDLPPLTCPQLFPGIPLTEIWFHLPLFGRSNEQVPKADRRPVCREVNLSNAAAISGQTVIRIENTLSVHPALGDLG